MQVFESAFFRLPEKNQPNSDDGDNSFPFSVNVRNILKSRGNVASKSPPYYQTTTQSWEKETSHLEQVNLFILVRYLTISYPLFTLHV